MSLEERSRARLKELEENRERFIADAQRNLAALDAAIGEIKSLLDPPEASVEQNGAGSPDEIPLAPEPVEAR